VVELDVPTGDGVEHRWVPVEYEAQLANPKVQIEVLRRYLRHSGPLTREAILHRYAFDEAWLDAALARLVASREVLQGHFTPTTQLTEYIDRYNLEQIHRRTLTLLRQEVKPVSVFAYTDFLTRWQHLHPRERLSGTNGLERVLQQLRAAPVPGSLWERDVLPARLTDFDSSDGLASLLAALEAMCQSGELVWIGSGGRDPRRSRVRFIFRGEGAIFLDSEPSAATLADLSEHARRAWEFLRSEGACFFADLRDGLGLVAASVQEALTELVMAGLVTNDTLQAMREVVQYGGAVEPPRRIASTLEAQLAERRQGLPRRRPSLQQMRAAKHRLSKRLREAPRWVGRWSLVHRAGVMGKPLSDEERLARQARQLLQRYGVVTRDSLEREEGAWDWGLLYTQFQLMEMRGEVRRGYFVAGLPGVQFALPEAVERLREAAATIDDTLIVLNACDPANIFGGEIDGTSLRFARLPSTALVLWRGQPVLVAESSGSSLRAAPGIDEGVLRGALAAMVAWLTERAWPRRFTVATWNDEPVVGGLAQAWLEQLGFFRDVGGMTWEEAPGATGMR
jgi:ATP-dependent Lhr-like helicase